MRGFLPVLVINHPSDGRHCLHMIIIIHLKVIFHEIESGIKNAINIYSSYQYFFKQIKKS